MCKECKKLIELYAETQLECLKRDRYISKCLSYPCEKCGNAILVCGETDTLVKPRLEVK